MIKTVLLNDTTRDVGHLGCRLVIDNIKHLCQKYGFEIFCSDRDASNFKEDEFVEKIKNAAVVILNGEGTLHDDAGEIWLQKAEIAKQMGKKVFLVNSVWQNNHHNKIYLELFDACSFRESFSFVQAKEDGAGNSFKVPDLSFYSFNKISAHSENPNKDLILIDSVRKNISKQIINYSYKSNQDLFFMNQRQRDKFAGKFYYRLLNKIFKKDFLLLNSPEQIGKYKFMLSGRFHACCMAMMTGTPAIAIDSNTWKTAALYKDAGFDDKFTAQNLTEALEHYSQVSPDDCRLWQEQARDFASNAVQEINNFWQYIS